VAAEGGCGCGRRRMEGSSSEEGGRGARRRMEGSSSDEGRGKREEGEDLKQLGENEEGTGFVLKNFGQTLYRRPLSSRLLVFMSTADMARRHKEGYKLFGKSTYPTSTGKYNSPSAIVLNFDGYVTRRLFLLYADGI
jgi:hypothetical protein